MCCCLKGLGDVSWILTQDPKSHRKVHALLLGDCCGIRTQVVAPQQVWQSVAAAHGHISTLNAQRSNRVAALLTNFPTSHWVAWPCPAVSCRPPICLTLPCPAFTWLTLPFPAFLFLGECTGNHACPLYFLIGGPRKSSPPLPLFGRWSSHSSPPPSSLPLVSTSSESHLTRSSCASSSLVRRPTSRRRQVVFPARRARGV
jgi:hypothetical protein